MRIKAFWENTHEAKRLALLSGCGYDETIDFLQVRELIKSGKCVLEVGVGMGYVTKGLHDAGVIVCGLDISDLALSRVKQYCERVFNVEEMDNLPINYYDVVICHNVIQHIPTDYLVRELDYIIRSLKDDGVFAMEFVSGEEEGDSWYKRYTYEKGLPTFTRSPEFMKTLVASAGGDSIMVVNNKCDIGRIKGCHVFHIRKRREV